MEFYNLFFPPTRSHGDNCKIPTFWHCIRIKIVVFDQDETWWGQCWRHNDKINVSLVAHFATHQGIRPKPGSIYKSINYEKIAFLRCPAQFWNFSAEFLTPCLIRTPALLILLLFFFATLSRFLFSLCILVRRGLCSTRGPPECWPQRTSKDASSDAAGEGGTSSTSTEAPEGQQQQQEEQEEQQRAYNTYISSISHIILQSSIGSTKTFFSIRSGTIVIIVFNPVGWIEKKVLTVISCNCSPGEAGNSSGQI